MANLRTFGRIICTTFAAVRPYNASLLNYVYNTGDEWSLMAAIRMYITVM